jgi:rod shape-determining protein MreD
MSVPWSQLTREEKRLRVINSWRLTAPTGTTIASLLVMLLPLWLPGPIMPQMGLLGVSVWVLNRRELMPPLAMFVIGLVQDLWLGAPLGLNALLLMTAGLVLSSQALVFAARPFSFAWAMMVLVAGLYCFASAGLMMVYRDDVSLIMTSVQAMLTALCYPLAVWMHARVQRRIVDPYLQEAV